MNVTNESINATMETTVNQTSKYNMLTLYSSFVPEAVAVDKYVTPYIYVIGFPGNVLSLIIWLRRRMRNSSGYYLAALALVDLIFLSLQVVYELNEKWRLKTLDLPFVCEVYPIVFLTSQYLSPLLVLSFTVERYISICHPFKRETYCTTKRAKYVICGVALGSLCINSVQGYFWTFVEVDGEKGCLLRGAVSANGTQSLWAIWTWCVEAVVFLLVPLAILVFNILVIIEAKRLSKYEQNMLRSRHQRNSATTVMLLAVSFYQIFTTLPVTVVVTLYYSFPTGDMNLLPVIDQTMKTHFQYYWAKVIIEEIGLTHYACNFYIYLLTGKVFRQEFKKLMRPLIGGLKVKLTSTSMTEYSIVRNGSTNHHSKKDTTVRMCNGKDNGHSLNNTETVPVLNADETPL